ncbi:glycosyltransferase [Roseobacter sp. OBYS 0001]|uniref:glycosyltransferase n=1 Tax=Roseobacter sp. OBYS 0001 TaxID=882651 RepID=UPI001BBB2DA2|nr:glycosyltransferase [Roseobacter sp. OBYS 0001]GIT89311.1 hypothetical protein ROBYS_43270 [Roseobacter sp. OBYS 0001]
MSVAVIIVNYATAELTLEAVESVISRDHGGRHVEIHVVDNASPENDAVVLAKAIEARGWQDHVTLYPETENHGFGRGCNVVLHHLTEQETAPEFVLLLNPDAQLQNEAIDLLAQDLEAHPEAAATGSGISLPSGGPVSAAFHFPTPRSEVAKAMHFGPALRLLRTRIEALPPETPAGEVDWVAGAAVLFRFAPLKAVGFFDPVFFLYYEEVDLMRRLTVAGHKVRYCPQARVLHHEGAATGVRSGAAERRRRPSYLYRSWRHYFSKSLGRRRTLAMALAMLGSAGVGRIIGVLRRKPSPLPLSFFRDQMQMVIGPLSGLRRDLVYDAEMARFVPRRVFTEAERGYINTNPSEIGFLALVAEDFRTHESDFFSQGFWALFWHRFGNLRMSVRHKLVRAPLTLIYRITYKLSQWMGGIDLPFAVIVGRRVKLEHFGGMILVAERIGDDVIIRQNTTIGIASVADLQGRPSIGNGVDIGAGAVIIGRIHVGENAVIGANAVVCRDVAKGSTVGGVPARPLRVKPRKSRK